MIDVRKYSYSSNLRDTAVDLLRELGEAAIFHDLGVQPGRHYVAAQVLAVIFSRLDCIYTYLYIHKYIYIYIYVYAFIFSAQSSTCRSGFCFLFMHTGYRSLILR